MVEKTIDKKDIYNGKIIDLVIHKIQTEDGRISQREVVKHPGAVCVVAVNEEKKIVFVKQFRKAIEDYLIEIPAGKLEKNEDPKDAVIRELNEETGYEVKKIDFVTKFFTSPGFADEIIHLYFAEISNKGNTNFDEGENIEIIEMSLDEALKGVSEGLISDSKTITGILLYQNMLRG